MKSQNKGNSTGWVIPVKFTSLSQALPKHLGNQSLVQLPKCRDGFRLHNLQPGAGLQHGSLQHPRQDVKIAKRSSLRQGSKTEKLQGKIRELLSDLTLGTHLHFPLSQRLPRKGVLPADMGTEMNFETAMRAKSLIHM